jgi:hypothetical protein
MRDTITMAFGFAEAHDSEWTEAGNELPRYAALGQTPETPDSECRMPGTTLYRFAVDAIDAIGFYDEEFSSIRVWVEYGMYQLHAAIIVEIAESYAAPFARWMRDNHPLITPCAFDASDNDEYDAPDGTPANMIPLYVIPAE